VHERPETHDVQTPPLHTASAPQIVPFGIGVVPFTHCCVPVAQEVVPARHGFGFVEQVPPATHAVHAPP
jgi:hypothetical protein